ncbi:MAG: undecaprenyldiphospho-muramoylpentapeptide beta-N-acetylglucosaminyltransferase [Alphaproteobacteria bacterium]|nr:undecaprenyldiphospho-muramoylpentapeptide beta-N-acetylglucosaminyltransferase [Alphaproteobacteria bacterium]MCB9974286.1 undecaprenyldiphospho-muramoylpentapeptide beta-N-acetylglucosaminyltransferase [Rhodospirillales bacterium]
METHPPESGSLVLISSGGTGGHMTPAAALAHDLVSRGNRVALVTDGRGSNYTQMFPEKTSVHVIRAGTIGGGPAGKLKGALNLAGGFVQAWGVTGRLRPSLVVGFGGYPSVPGVLAAQLRKIPTIIHEQNAVLGKANLFLAARAERIALSFPDMTGLDKAECLRAVITGNPVRSEIAALQEVPYNPAQEDGVFNILVMGGSLGASVFAKIVPEALARLKNEDKSRLNVVQQCREADIESARKQYEEAGIKADLAAFYNDMALKLSQAHLVICRSGASTVAELTASGRPAIYVPYPHHKDQQQKKNAQHVVDSGGAWMMTEDVFTPKALLAKIEGFLLNPGELSDAAQKAGTFGKPDAARRLGNLVTAVMTA